MNKYLTYPEYIALGHDSITVDEFDKFEHNCERSIDALSFNRIRHKGFQNLTKMQQELVKEAMCYIVDFYYDNKEIFQNVFTHYAINGVSMDFGKFNDTVRILNGQILPIDAVVLLEQSGLSCLSFRW